MGESSGDFIEFLGAHDAASDDHGANEIELVDVTLIAALLGEPGRGEFEGTQLAVVVRLAVERRRANLRYGPAHDADDDEGVARGENFGGIIRR